MASLVFKNDSSASVYYAFNGCDSDLLSVRPSEPRPAARADEQQFWKDLAAGDGCVCRCSDLASDELCTRDKCNLQEVYCPAILGYREVAPGQEVATSEQLFTAELDRTRQCVARLPYPDGTEFTARFCWWPDDPQKNPGSTQSCAEVRFVATDAEVSFELTDQRLMRGPDDAG